MTCHTGVTQRKGQGKDDVEQETWKGHTLGKRQQTCQGCNKGINDLENKQPLYLRKGRTATNSIGGWARRQQL
jgi:hypothetical protein